MLNVPPIVELSVRRELGSRNTDGPGVIMMVWTSLQESPRRFLLHLGIGFGVVVAMCVLITVSLPVAGIAASLALLVLTLVSFGVDEADRREWQHLVVSCVDGLASVLDGDGDDGWFGFDD